jgi:hypothetical protein
MRRFLFLFSLMFLPSLVLATPRFTVQQDEKGARVLRDGEPFMIKGVNWGSIPVGENYSYDLWSRSDADILAVLDVEMPLLKNMGVNAIRQFAMIPPRWVGYIYETYGIHTVMNHLMGRYGFTVDGVQQSPVDYSDPRLREAIKKDVLLMVDRYKNTPGVLFWMLGNENNYGLAWTSSKIENLPQGERDAAKARYLYSLFGEIAAAIKASDPQHLVTICNGDIQYLDLIAKEAPAIDLLGVNVYRGKTATDLFTRVKTVLGKPVFFSEFGADAFNARSGREDGVAQAEFLKSQWLDLYQNSHGHGGAGNAVGGFVFQWSDEWWKYKQTENLAVHDQTASWSNQGYAYDFQAGSNNMNEEWFGIMAKSKNDARGRYRLTPRPAYFMLRDIFALNPYATERSSWEGRIAGIQPQAYEPESEALRAAGRIADVERFFLKSGNIHLESIQSSGRNTNKGTREGWSSDDHMESVTLEWGWRPDPRLEASAAIHVLGNVAENKMDEIFYENRGRPVKVKGEDGKYVTLNDRERVKLHRAWFEWNEDAFKLEGFYRAPHGHWADEGDFFGLFQETYDMAGIDRYNSDAPNGFIFSGKSQLEGLKVAFGPQIYWGAKPMAIVKYSGQFADLNYTVMHQEAFAEQKTVATSNLTDPGGRAGRSSLSFKTSFLGLKSEWGLLQSGRERIGERYVSTEKTDDAGYNGSKYEVTEGSSIKAADTLAGKFRLIQSGGPLPWYLQGAYRGLVANGGPDSSIVLTKWSLKPSERGNQYNVAAGFSAGSGSWSVAPQIVYQKPLVGPVPHDPLLNTDQFDAATGTYTAGLRPRNLLNDTFAVLDNREMLGAELLFVFDPTPDSWFFAWDNDDRESARFAASLDLIYRRFPTSRDSSIGVLADGTVFAFASAPPSANLWDAVFRAVQVLSPELRMIHQIYGGTGQANGDSPRLIKRYGLGSTLRWQRLQAQLMTKWNDWGPYDYYRDYNLTFPFQGQISLAYGLEPFRVDRPISQVGMRYQMRTLDENSPRFPYAPGSGKHGDEQEWTTYVDINI